MTLVEATASDAYRMISLRFGTDDGFLDICCVPRGAGAATCELWIGARAPDDPSARRIAPDSDEHARLSQLLDDWIHAHVSKGLRDAFADPWLHLRLTPEDWDRHSVWTVWRCMKPAASKPHNEA